MPYELRSRARQGPATPLKDASGATSSTPSLTTPARPTSPPPTTTLTTPPPTPPPIATTTAATSTTQQQQRRSELAALGLLPLLPALWVVVTNLNNSSVDLWPVGLSAGVAGAGALLTTRMIPVTMQYMLRRGLSGLDINKRGSSAGTNPVPESLGLVSGIMFLVCVIVFQHFYFSSDSIWLVQYNAALASICFMLFLGFVDDVLDIPWRYKLLLPAVAALPLLVSYSGSTAISIPKPLRDIIGHDLIQLGWMYKLYMALWAVFCSNAVNILAGVNGLEAGQSYVTACAVLALNLTMLGGAAVGNVHVRDAHLFSAFIMLPFISTTFALLTFNWYPSSVFVGDTFAYFAGMTLAVSSILGHFTETMVIFFIPQIFNFLYSVPQLFKWVPCPRHRLPRFDPSTGLLHGSDDMNLLNLTLRVGGPCTEKAVVVRLLGIQAACCVLGFVLRFALTGVYK